MFLLYLVTVVTVVSKNNMPVLGHVGPFAMEQVGPFAMGQVGPLPWVKLVLCHGASWSLAMGQVGPECKHIHIQLTIC